MTTHSPSAPHSIVDELHRLENDYVPDIAAEDGPDDLGGPGPVSPGFAKRDWLWQTLSVRFLVTIPDYNRRANTSRHGMRFLKEVGVLGRHFTLRIGNPSA